MTGARIIGVLLLLTALPGSILADQLAPPPGQLASEDGFNWQGALAQSGLFHLFQHSTRMLQHKTRRELGGPFWADYADSVSNIRTWSDQDGIPTNYLGHPALGAVYGYFQVHNDPQGRLLEFAPRSADYWKSRLKALGWSAMNSTQFEIGPLLSEAALGNVGQTPPTMAWVDLVVTPLGGFGMMLLEDYLDQRFVSRIEQSGGFKARFFRVVLNPNRALANVFRGRLPSHRDSRPLPRR